MRHFTKAVNTDIEYKVDGASGVAIYDQDTLYVSRLAQGAPLHGGVDLCRYGKRSDFITDISSYDAISVTADGLLTVKNRTTNRIEAYNRLKTKILEFGLPNGDHKGIAVLDDGSLLVCDAMYSCIRMYNNAGELLNIIQNEDVRKPGAITVTDRSIIVISQQDYPTIVKMDRDGKTVWTYDKLDTPESVAADENDDVYVCDSEMKKVVMVTSDGQLSFNMVTSGAFIGGRPCGVAVHQDIMAIQTTSNKIKLFKLT